MSAGKIESALAQRLSSSDCSDIQAAYLYGSEAAGRAHAQSDVDLAVLLDRGRHPSAKERFDRRLDLMALLAGTAVRTLDLVVLNDLPPLFARRIIFEGRRIHVADVEIARAFERDVQLLAADLEPFLRRMGQIKLEGLLET